MVSLGTRLVIASHNPGKVQELAALLAPFGIKTRGAAAYGVPAPEESGTSFSENAAHKAVSVARAVGLPALADDSGLSVRALGGAPGVYSSRFAAGDYTGAMARLQKALGAVEDRRAVFECALALAYQPPGGPSDAEWCVEVFQGSLGGVLVWPPRGRGGFGYDPMFLPDGPLARGRTLAQMSPQEKESVSHRAVAFEKFAARWLASRTSP